MFAELKQSCSLNFSQLLVCLGEPPLNLTVANKTHAWRHCLCSQAIVKVQKHPILAPRVTWRALATPNAQFTRTTMLASLIYCSLSIVCRIELHWVSQWAYSNIWNQIYIYVYISSILRYIFLLPMPFYLQRNGIKSYTDLMIYVFSWCFMVQWCSTLPQFWKPSNETAICTRRALQKCHVISKSSGQLWRESKALRGWKKIQSLSILWRLYKIIKILPKL